MTVLNDCAAILATEHSVVVEQQSTPLGKASGTTTPIHQSMIDTDSSASVAGEGPVCCYRDIIVLYVKYYRVASTVMRVSMKA